MLSLRELMDTSTPQELNSAKDANPESALRDDEFWREIPEYAGIGRETFLDYRWQSKNSPPTRMSCLQF